MKYLLALIPIILVIIFFSLPRPSPGLISPVPEILPAPFPSTLPSPSPIPSPTPNPSPRKVLGTSTHTTRYPRMSIALVGDSMIDTLGTNAPFLVSELNQAYPTTNFTIYNYGIGATTIDTGLDRLTNPYTNNNDRNYDPITSLKPDVVIIESFAYNPILPLTDATISHHTDILTQMVNLLKSAGISRIVLMSTIAPNIDQFPGSESHPPAINAYLKNTFTVAKNLNLPIIDAYHSSTDLLGNGLLDYISPDDHIHPSEAGHKFIAKRIADTLVKNKILE